MADTQSTLKKAIHYTSYGASGFALSVLGIPLYMYLPTYYSFELGQGVGMVGLVLLLARMFDMVTDPLIGYGADRFGVSFARRMVLMGVGALVLLVGYYALISPPQQATLGIWLFFFSFLTYTGWSLVSIPYMALGAQISYDYHQKSLLSSARETMAILGMIAALAIPYALDIASIPSQTLSVLYQIVLIGLPLGLVALYFGVQRDKIDQFSHHNLTYESAISLLRNSSVQHLVGAYFTNALANAIPSTLFLYFVSLVLELPSHTGALLLLYFASGIVGLPFWLWLSSHIGKKQAWIYSMLLASVSFAFVPFLGAGDGTIFVIVVGVSGLSLGADLTLSSSLQADLAQSFEQEKDNVSGLLFGIWGMCTKLALALGVGIAFGILGLLGFEAQSPNSASLQAIPWLYGGVPVILKLISIMILRSLDKIK